MDNYTQFLSFNLTHSPRKNFYYNFKLSAYSYLFNQKPSDYTNTTDPGVDYVLTLWGFMRYPSFPDEPFDKYSTAYKVKKNQVMFPLAQILIGKLITIQFKVRF